MTASGKTSASIQLAKKINAQIICADSRIVYKDLDIVSAKPTKEEQDGIIHHLIDIVSPNEDFSAGDFVNLAKEKIEEIFNQNQKVIICGGTWFYIKSLLDEKSLPECKINHKLREELSKLSNQELWQKLFSLDKKRVNEIHQNNKDKVIRSIEMCLELNQPISEYQRKANEIYPSKWYMLDFEREELYQRINRRVDIMINQGLIEEWENNRIKYPDSLILRNTIGYKEFFELKEGIYKDEKEAIEKVKQHTRNFAKRQITYFNSNKNIKKIKNYTEILKDLNYD